MSEEVVERIVLGEGDIDSIGGWVRSWGGELRQGAWFNARLVVEVLPPPPVPVKAGQWRKHPTYGPVHIDGPSQLIAGSWRWHARAARADGGSVVDVESWPICDRPEWAVGPVVGEP